MVVYGKKLFLFDEYSRRITI